MSHDALAAPTRFATRIAHHLGEIADTLDWDHCRWLVLTARLEATGKAPDALTLGRCSTPLSPRSRRQRDERLCIECRCGQRRCHHA